MIGFRHPSRVERSAEPSRTLHEGPAFSRQQRSKTPVWRRTPCLHPSRPASATLATLLALTFAFSPVHAADSPPANPAAATLFEDDALTTFVIDISPAAAASLRNHPRTYAHATLRAAGLTLPDVAVRLKGTRTFQSLDEKPSWTLDFERFQPGRTFHGLARLQLGNAADDPACLNEILGSELFRAAGIPAPRAANARVTLNGRALGLYVLKEGFAGDFLKRSFGRPDALLYDNDHAADIDQPLHHRGATPDPDPLHTLAAAVRESIPAARWQQIDTILDRDRFVTFMAMEQAVGHRDGYSVSRNNFRICLDPVSSRLTFLPDGMDQLFGREPFPVEPRMAGLVAAAVMGTSEGHRLYQERVRQLLDTVLQVDPLVRRIDHKLAALRPALSAGEFRVINEGATDLKERLRIRDAALRRQLDDPGPGRPVFADGTARLRHWMPVDAPSARTLGFSSSPDGRPSLHIVAGPATSASWRNRSTLDRGRYRFEARCRVSGVVPRPGLRARGAALRVAGSARQGPELVGDSDWTLLQCDVSVTDGDVTELLCELVADRGELWVELDSLRLVKLPESGHE